MLKQSVFGDLSHELATTRRVLERLPDEYLAWRPAAESSSLGELGNRIVDALRWQLAILQQDELDIGESNGVAVPAHGAELLRRFDADAAEVQNALDALDDAALVRPWTLRHGTQIIFTVPKAAVLRSTGISHMAHHRGQLTTYLRMLNVPLPGRTGPGAQ